MTYRSPARWMAPLALVAVLVAVGAIVRSTTGDDAPAPAATSTAASERSEETSTQEGGGEEEQEQTSTSTTDTTATTESGPRTYRVEAGDTLGSIAEETGVTVEELQELNPDVDPQSLTVGQRIRLR